MKNRSDLLGIRTVEQLATHPLTGHLFENMVAVEALKNQLNRGKSKELYFYRNASGSIEIDLLIEDGLLNVSLKRRSCAEDEVVGQVAEGDREATRKRPRVAPLTLSPTGMCFATC